MNGFEIIIRQKEDFESETVTWELKHDENFPPTMSSVIGVISQALVMMQLHELGLLELSEFPEEEDTDGKEKDGR